MAAFSIQPLAFRAGGVILSPMTPHEIKPKQLRALLCLLVLVPLIPTALMIRFMTDALKAERLTAVEQAQQFYAGVLAAALRAAPAADADVSESGRAAAVITAARKLGDANMTVRVIGSGGAVIGGDAEAWGQPVAQDSFPGLPELTVQIHLKGPGVVEQGIAGQRNTFIMIGAGTTLGVVLIAGLAAMAVHRQIGLNELRNTSAATVAHELRTPLASMRMLVDTLREKRYRGEQQLHEYLDLVAAENERLSRLAENFLTFSRLQRGMQPWPMSPVAPHEVAVQAIRPLKARLDAAGFAFDVPGSLPAVLADRDALAQVLTNLMDNALKYTGDEKRIALSARVAGTMVAFSVEDNGIGIAAGDRRSIFKPFHQLDQKLSRSNEGCGLGLAIVGQIVDAHGGEIEVAGAPGKGSVFTVKIPAA